MLLLGKSDGRPTGLKALRSRMSMPGSRLTRSLFRVRRSARGARSFVVTLNIASLGFAVIKNPSITVSATMKLLTSVNRARSPLLRLYIVWRSFGVVSGIVIGKVNRTSRSTCVQQEPLSTNRFGHRSPHRIFWSAQGNSVISLSIWINGALTRFCLFLMRLGRTLRCSFALVNLRVAFQAYIPKPQSSEGEVLYCSKASALRPFVWLLCGFGFGLALGFVQRRHKTGCNRFSPTSSLEVVEILTSCLLS